jgi:hypothetical protein
MIPGELKPPDAEPSAENEKTQPEDSMHEPEFTNPQSSGQWNHSDGKQGVLSLNSSPHAIPHFTNGVSGRSFPSPFASPPGKEHSSPTINVLWGALNPAAGYLLLCHVGEFHVRRIPDALVLGAGDLLMGIQLARWFGRAFGGH